MLLSLDNVTFGYLGTPILQGVSLSLHEKERIGFIGGNGEGKTTLLKLIIGQLIPDEGQIFRKNGLKIGYLEQSGGLESNATVYEAMEEVFEEDKKLIARLREKETDLSTATQETLIRLSSEIENLNKRIAARDSYHFDVRIKTVLSGMGFADTHGQVVNTMSGGEKTRLKLCKLLLEEPELLILDEPTNHLDVKTLFWLEEYLNEYKGALLIVSHDRFFLDRLTSRTLELEWGIVCSYKGNYTKYKQLKSEDFLRKIREYEKQQEEIAHLQDYVNRNLVRATTAKSALSRVNQLEKMTMLEKPVPPPQPPRFSFSYDERPYEKVLTTTKFDLYAQEKLLLKEVEFSLLRGEKCALLGENGTGKTTLMKFLLSKDNCITLGKYVKIGYYDQENADLDPEERVLEAFWGKNSLMTQTQARKLLAQSGLDKECIDKKVKELSGGLRAKLELALLQAKHGNVLFLDEPTNHLDLPSREALEDALKQYDGTILFVSHDRRFIQEIATKIILLENNRLTYFSGDYESYLAEKKKQQFVEIKQEKSPAPTNGYRSKEDRAKEARTRNRTKEIEKELELLEREEAEQNELLVLHASNYQKVMEITKKLDEIHAKSDALYAEYETLI